MIRVLILSATVLILALYWLSHPNAPFPTKVYHSTYFVLALTAPLLLVCRKSSGRIAGAVGLSWAMTLAWGMNTELISRKMTIPLGNLLFLACIGFVLIIGFSALVEKIRNENEV